MFFYSDHMCARRGEGEVGVRGSWENLLGFTCETKDYTGKLY